MALRKSGNGIPGHTQKRGFGQEPKGRIHPKSTGGSLYGAPDVANVTPNNRTTKLDSASFNGRPDNGLSTRKQNSKVEGGYRQQFHHPGAGGHKGSGKGGGSAKSAQGTGNGLGRHGIKSMNKGRAKKS